MSAPILQIEDLHIEFKTARGPVHALNGLSFEVQPAEVFGIVGETGCGKTLTGMAVLQLLPKTARITQGKIFFEGQDLLRLSEKEMRKVRGGKISIIFQDPSSSLNPLFTVGSQMLKVMKEHLSLPAAQYKERVLTMLAAVGLPDVERIYNSYPHQLSGGMIQRVMIALALACEHSLIIADEPTTALDVTIQAQILRLMRELQQKLDISMILITHNLGVIAEMCDRLMVLYAGRAVEMGITEAIFSSPCHPYTRGLMNAIPRPSSRGSELAAIPGTVPSDPGKVSGCVFAPRCAYAFDRCRVETPQLLPVEAGHFRACFLEREALK